MKKEKAVETPVADDIVANDGLPSRPTKQTVDPQSLRVLVIAPPGWGKTTLLSAFPDSLLLAFEEGHKFVECNKIVIDKWEGKEEGVDDDGNLHLSAMEAFARIDKSDRFKFIIIDTIDAMTKMCSDHFIALYHGEHLQDLGDYGKGYDIGQNTPVRKAINALLKTGRGMGYITHQKVVETKNKKNEIVSAKKQSSMPEGIMKIIYPQVDSIFHGEFGSLSEGSKVRDRILRTEGSEDFLAKNRGGVFPPAWIVPKTPREAWEQIQEFLTHPATIEVAYKEFLEVYEG